MLERLCDRRVLASIAGAVFEDADLSFRREASESGLADRLVYLDLNDDGTFGSGEPYRLTDAQGAYAFDDLTPGDYVVRLFNGTQSQRQTVPLAPQLDGLLAVPEASALRTTNQDGFLYALRPQAVARIEPLSGTISQIALPAPAASIHPLPDGRLLVLASDDPAATEHAWLVSFDTSTVTAVDLGLAADETGWASAAVDASGHGVLIARGPQDTVLRQLSLVDGQLTATPTGDFVPPGAEVMTSADATASLIAVPSEEGLNLLLWSNATATPIPGASATIAGGAALLDFDDASGLAVVRGEAGETLVYDVAGGFALLQQFDGLSETVAVDGARDLLFAIDQAGDLLIRDLRAERVLASLTIETPESIVPIQASALALADGGEAILVSRGSDLARIRLDRPAAKRLSLGRGEAASDVLFGMAVEGTNTAPRFDDHLIFQVTEDTALQITAPALLASAVDVDPSDQFVLLPGSGPMLGSAVVDPQGSLLYQPRDDAFGNDQLSLVLHDGRTASVVTPVQVKVIPVNDPLGPAIVDLPGSIPESITPGTAIGSITLSNPDPGEIITFASDDRRFDVEGDLIVYVGPDELDYESESFIQFTVVANDGTDGEEYLVADVQLQITNVNEPIVDVTPSTANVEENAVGVYVTWIEVVDTDWTGEYTVEVDDDRFEIVDGQLQLVEGVFLDYEAEPEVVVQLTATDTSPGGNSITTALTITVGDVNESATTIWFEGDSVLERLSGAIVGPLMIDDPDQPTNAQFSVDDSRFEFAGSLLKLRDGVWVERAVQEQIELTLTASDSDFTMSIDVVIAVLANEHPYQNPHMDGDVDGNGRVDALDALIIINYINANGPGPIIDTVNSDGDGFYVDVNGDGMVTPLDALLVINLLNQQLRNTPPSTVNGEQDGEGESHRGMIAQQPPLVPLTAPLSPSAAEPLVATPAPLIADRTTADRSTPVDRPAPVDEMRESPQRKADGFDAVDRLAADAWMQHYADDAEPRRSAADDVDADVLAANWQHRV